MHDAHSEVPHVRTMTPYGYMRDIEPPKGWSRTIDGHRITPKVIQDKLKRCKEAGYDMKYIAKRLDVGYGVIAIFLKNEKTIPMSCAEKFYKLFTSGEAIPKAAPEDEFFDSWLEEEEEESRANICRVSPDFDAERLAPALIAEREKRGLTVLDVARSLRVQSKHIITTEKGLKRYRSKNSIVDRLCKFYGLDVRDFELKPRIRFAELQERLKKAKADCGLKWKELQEKTGVNPETFNSVLFRKNYGDIVYLSNEIKSATAGLGVDITEFFEKR